MSRFLEAFAEFMSDRGHRIHRVAEYCVGGEIETMELSPATPCQNIYSIAKVFTGAAVGMLVDRGLLSTGDLVTDALGRFCPASFQPEWKATTVHMLLMHRVGLPKNFMDIDCADANDFGPDYLAYVMNHPLGVGHGTQRTYTDAAHYILSCIVENLCGMPMDNFLWRELFRPLGFRDAAWSHCPMGHAIGATGLYLRVEDMIKLGAVYLQGGVWQGRRILSEAWTGTVLQAPYELSPVGVGRAYSKGGMLGQNLIVVPECGRVAAWQAADACGQQGAAEFVCRYR